MIIDGTNANDILGKKDLGADKMTGHAGDDIYYVNNKGDTVIESANEGIDTVISAIDFTLSDNVEILSLRGLALTGTGNALDNHIYGNSGDNVLHGLAGNDFLSGESGSDSVYGDEGDDELHSGAGGDKLFGGVGNDRYVIENNTDIITENKDEGIDSVYSSADYVLVDNVENLILNGNAAKGTGNGLDNKIKGNDAANTLDGLAGNDTLNGLAGDDILTGDAGDDSLSGGDGKDQLDGGTGIDTLVGGKGDDRYIVDNVKDVVVELNTTVEGIDTIYSSVDYALSPNVEDLVLGKGALKGTGNELDNKIKGNEGANTLDGGAGDDVLNGLAGDDKLIGGDGNNTLIGGEGADQLIGGTGKNIFDLTEKTQSIDKVVIGQNTTSKVLDAASKADINNDVDVIKGFDLGVDKLVTPIISTRVFDAGQTKQQGFLDTEDLINSQDARGDFRQHVGSNGIYTHLYDKDGKEVVITAANEKQAIAYLLNDLSPESANANANANGKIGAFHMTGQDGKVHTIVVAHQDLGHSTENFVMVDVVGNVTNLSSILTLA